MAVSHFVSLFLSNMLASKKELQIAQPTVSRRRANHLFQDCKIKLGILFQLQSTFSLVLAFANSFISLLPGQNFCGNQTNRLETSFPHVSEYGLPICRKFGFFAPSKSGKADFTMIIYFFCATRFFTKLLSGRA